MMGLYWKPFELARAKRPKRKDMIIQALNDIKPGETVLYHVGSLMFDRVRSRSVDEVGTYALKLASEKPARIHLVQRVLEEPSVFLYIAIGTRQR